MTDPTLTDDDARATIGADFDSTLFVKAGAGSGKTHALVQRIRGLVCAAGVEIPRIAAITFTEKAAAELRDRIRSELEAARRDDDPTVADRAARAIDDIDSAAIGTLHSFAQRLLSERAIEAGLPPRIEILDEVGSDVNFAERWGVFIDALLEHPDGARPFRVCSTKRIGPDDLRVMAQKLEDNWDRLETALDPVPPVLPDPLDPVALADEILSTIQAVEDMDCIRTRAGHINNNAGKRIDEWHACAERVRSAHDDAAVLAAFGEGLSEKVGAQNEARDALLTTAESVKERVTAVLLGCVRWFGWHIGRFVLDGAQERRAEGTLEFHDLLVLARGLLRDPVHGPEARSSLGRRYHRLLLDEFQDTDPIQIEIAVLLAAADPLDTGLSTRPWHEIAVEAGRLFFVGDPKQSIYRFRRADISLFLAAEAAYGPAISLTSNFRSQRDVIRFVNDVCGGLIEEKPGAQAAYEPLDAIHDDRLIGPKVSMLDGIQRTVNEARSAEASDIASTIALMVDDGWTLTDTDDAGQPTTRPAELADVCILLPGRTSLNLLLGALEDAGIPYRTESSTLVYAAEEIREIMAALRAINDPTDQLATVTALRSSLFGCGDDDLVEWKLRRGGNWNLRSPLTDDQIAHPVGDAMSFLQGLHLRQHVLTPAEIVEALVAGRFGFEVTAVRGRFRDRWRRLRFVIDQARAWATVGDGTLRSYLQWVHLQSQSGRTSESILPESDNDAVRIMTIHSAKGLEFPICIVAGLATQPNPRWPKVDAQFVDGAITYRAGKDAEEPEYRENADIDEQMSEEERRRLLYVALTRAEDHLIVSIHRSERDRGSLAGLVAGEVAGMAEPPPTLEPEWVEPADDTTDTDLDALAGLAEFGDWTIARAAALSASRRRATVSATAIARFEPSAAEDTSPEVLDDEGDTGVDPGTQKQARDLDLPPWQKGRYGTAVGRAVHGVMQSVDLITGDGIDAAVASQAAAEGLIGRERVIHRLAASGLASEAVRTARGLPHWKEMFVAAPLPDGTTIEGYIDLVYRAIDGLVIVDYKTDAVPDDESLAAKVESYRIQLAAYAVALEQVLGEPVARCQLVFLREEGSQTVDIADLDTAKTEAAVRAAALASA